jgi:cell fate (sporulation/competence/biofilm development) regulator YmcA (YheA/YmcA/DUF963 family)
MNLVKSILDQLSGGALDTLASNIGADAEKTRTAASAAVPAILSALTGMAATDSGARKLGSTLDGLDLGSLGNLASALGGDGSSLAQKGSQLLASLLGDNLVSSIAAAVSQFSGLDPAAAKKLIASLAPTALGLLGSQWKSQGGTIGGLSSLLAGQKKNLAAAVPAGFSLADIPGLPSADAALRVAGQAARRTADAAEDATKSVLTWAAAIAGLALIALGLWYFFGRGAAPRVAQNPAGRAADATQDAANRASTAVTALRPELPSLPAVPDITAITKDVSGIFTSATQTLTGIRDAASAQAALPKLAELNTKIDGIRDVLDKLPETAQVALGQLVGKQLAPLQQQADKILAMPGVSEQVKQTLEGITSKLAGLNLAQVSKDATDLFSTLTKTLNGLKDTASAEAALPKLQEVSGKIDDLKRVQTQMSPGGQSMVARIVTAARGSLEQLIAKVLTALGADAAVVKPVLDDILDKLTGLAAPSAAREPRL